jgi:hypothetical protein
MRMFFNTVRVIMGLLFLVSSFITGHWGTTHEATIATFILFCSGIISLLTIESDD